MLIDLLFPVQGDAVATDHAYHLYAALSREVKQSGLLKRRPGYYSVKVGANLLLLATGWTAFALIGLTGGPEASLRLLPELERRAAVPGLPDGSPVRVTVAGVMSPDPSSAAFSKASLSWFFRSNSTSTSPRATCVPGRARRVMTRDVPSPPPPPPPPPVWKGTVTT